MKKFLMYAFLFLLPTALMSSSTSIAGAPGIPGVKVVTRHGEKIDIYKDYHALVMGVGSYRKWPKLPNAVADAKEVAAGLKNLGFHVKLVLDPTYREMKSALKEMIHKMGSEADRAVLFYYAGNGYTQKLPDKTRMGYIIPTDCPLLEEDSLGFAGHAISMKDIESASLLISSRHVIMLFDSCFSMSLFALFRAVPDDITKKSALPVRQFITAGRENETMPDKSIFKRCFLKGLYGDADSNDDGYITGSELGMYLQQGVPDYTKRRQHPQYAKINNPDFDTGDFIFVPLRMRRKQLAETKKAQEDKEISARKERESIRGIEEAKIKQLEAERKAALEKARKEAAEKKTLEEELKRMKAEKRLLEEAARKKELEEELKRLKTAQAREQQKKETEGKAGSLNDTYKSGKDPFFLDDFEDKDLWSANRYFKWKTRSKNDAKITISVDDTQGADGSSCSMKIRYELGQKSGVFIVASRRHEFPGKTIQEIMIDKSITLDLSRFRKVVFYLKGKKAHSFFFKPNKIFFAISCYDDDAVLKSGKRTWVNYYQKTVIRPGKKWRRIEIPFNDLVPATWTKNNVNYYSDKPDLQNVFGVFFVLASWDASGGSAGSNTVWIDEIRFE
ncbi:MAG: caspase family protein [Deltaproteobacteria bacterium]|nr:caspase family protein [Deltaproteobacteria bacterium]